MLDTEQIMKMAVKLSGFKSVPADSEIHVKGRNIRKVLVAIDVGVAELLLAKELGCDAVIAHHPAGGHARLYGYKVFERHIDQMVEAGVPRNVAIKAVKSKLDSLELTHHSDNYDQVPVAAKKLNMPLLSIHSPCDEMGRQVLMKTVKDFDKNGSIGKLILKIRELPEYGNAESHIQIRLGSENSTAGKISVSHAAYTNGGYDVAREYFDHGTETLAYIHVAENDLVKLSKEEHGNLIILGHIASDWLGLNVLISQLGQQGIEVEATTNLTSRS
jgi:putative NIF3 family GTP cyclohydrolase 1 type 2